MEGYETINVKFPEPTIEDIAIVKSYNYCEEYNATTGCITEKHGARFLKQGFIDGFLAGFTHKFTGEE